MADSFVYPFGNSGDIAFAASDKVACYSDQQYQVFQNAGFPNIPNAQVLLFEGSGYFTSSAFSAAGSVVIAAGAAPVSYNIGTAAVAGVVTGIPTQGAPGELNSNGTLTAALILGGIVTSTTGAAVTATLDTGAIMDAAVSMNVNDWFDWSAINTGGANAFTVTAAASGHTVVGAGAVAASSSGRFRTRKTATNTFVTYRLS